MKRAVVFLMGLFIAAGAQAAPQVAWEDLIDPKAGAFNDPFAALTGPQLRSLGTVLRLREALQAGEMTAEARPETEARLRREEAKLAASGIQVDWLLSQRTEIGKKRAEAALAGNPALDGTQIAITGFVIPVQAPDSATVSSGYLVPQYGMCSHMPAPNPNQMIRYTLQTDWQAEYIYEQVMLVGTLSLQTTRQEITLLDGQIDMIAAFEMMVTDVRSVEEASGPNPASRLWNLFRRPDRQRSWKHQ